MLVRSPMIYTKYLIRFKSQFLPVWPHYIEFRLSDTILRIYLFNIWRDTQEHSHRPDVLMKYVSENINIDLENLADSAKSTINKKVTNFCAQLQVRWNKCYRTLNRVLSENKAWLDDQIQFEEYVSSNGDLNEGPSNVARPGKSLAESG